MKVINYYLLAFKKYIQFSGRSQRAEYWYFFLANVVIGFVLGGASRLIGGDVESVLQAITTLYSLIVVLPGLALTVRRLHDIEKSGWWALIVFIPLFGVIVLWVWMAADSQRGKNKYGPNPKNEGGARPQEDSGGQSPRKPQNQQTQPSRPQQQQQSQQQVQSDQTNSDIPDDNRTR